MPDHLFFFLEMKNLLVIKRIPLAGWRKSLWNAFCFALTIAVCSFTATLIMSVTKGLPVSIVHYELDDDGFAQFYTNDSRYYDQISWILEENINGPNEYEIECKKISGTRNHEYGMIFGASDMYPYEYYSISITANGDYRVWKKDDDIHTTIKNWAYSRKLYPGYNKINSIKVTQSGSIYTVFLNNNQVYQFEYTGAVGSKVGFHNIITTDESFPRTPVDVRFRQKHEFKFKVASSQTMSKKLTE